MKSVEENLNVNDVKEKDHTTAANPTPDLESNTSESVEFTVKKKEKRGRQNSDTNDVKVKIDLIVGDPIANM